MAVRKSEPGGSPYTNPAAKKRYMKEIGNRNLFAGGGLRQQKSVDKNAENGQVGFFPNGIQLSLPKRESAAPDRIREVCAAKREETNSNIKKTLKRLREKNASEAGDATEES